MNETVVDSRVSRVKFNREVARYRQFERDYIRRGWWMVRAEFPEIWVNFVTHRPPQVPPAVVFGARIDFTNYDLWPPSVRLVHALTGEPYKLQELPTLLPRRLTPTLAPIVPTQLQLTDSTSPTEANPTGNGAQGPQQILVQNIMQAFSLDAIPFLCLPGVREYHTNPGHTGDSWFLYRGTAVGTLNYILEQLYKYGVVPLQQVHQFQVQLLRAHFIPVPEEIPV